jgi:hypothetical protein
VQSKERIPNKEGQLLQYQIENNAAKIQLPLDCDFRLSLAKVLVHQIKSLSFVDLFLV